jgi:pSer/pThr/pTyr-binding forkhead associated (FHA) protein
MTAPLSSLLHRSAHAVPVLRLPGPDEPFLLVGRSSRCDVAVDDLTVSREHAGLVVFGGQWFVCDRDSTNGTRVNGRRIWGTASVHPGDLVSFGDATFRLTRPA